MQCSFMDRDAFLVSRIFYSLGYFCAIGPLISFFEGTMFSNLYVTQLKLTLNHASVFCYSPILFTIFFYLAMQLGVDLFLGCVECLSHPPVISSPGCTVSENFFDTNSHICRHNNEAQRFTTRLNTQCERMTPQQHIDV